MSEQTRLTAWTDGHYYMSTGADFEGALNDLIHRINIGADVIRDKPKSTVIHLSEDDVARGHVELIISKPLEGLVGLVMPSPQGGIA